MIGFVMHAHASQGITTRPKAIWKQNIIKNVSARFVLKIHSHTLVLLSLWGRSPQIIHPIFTFTLKPHLGSKMNILAQNTRGFQRTLDATRSKNPSCCWFWMQATCFKVQTFMLPAKQVNNTWCSLMGLWYAGINISFTVAQWIDGHSSCGKKCVF